MCANIDWPHQHHRQGLSPALPAATLIAAHLGPQREVAMTPHMLGRPTTAPMVDMLAHLAPAPTEALGQEPAVSAAAPGELLAWLAAPEELLCHPPPTGYIEMSAGPGRHAADNVCVQIAAMGGGAGPSGPCARTANRPAAAVMEEQAWASVLGQKLLHHLPLER
ncbi:UNVERIFIED_CONTAM: hypothetical protein K2H54_043173 [Gekko kuhli]